MPLLWVSLNGFVKLMERGSFRKTLVRGTETVSLSGQQRTNTESINIVIAGMREKERETDREREGESGGGGEGEEETQIVV